MYVFSFKKSVEYRVFPTLVVVIATLVYFDAFPLLFSFYYVWAKIVVRSGVF